MMILSNFKSTVLIWFLVLTACGNTPKTNTNNQIEENTKTEEPKPIMVGANNTNAYLPLLKGKKIAVVANQTSVIFKNDNFSNFVNSSLSTCITHLIKFNL